MCNLQWSNPNLTGFGTLSGFTAVIKHKWEPPFWSCSHFVIFELLHPWRQATVIMVGCGVIFTLPEHFEDNFYSPLLSGSAFYGVTFWLSLRFFLTEYLPGRSVSRIQRSSSLAIRSSAAWTLGAFQPSCPPEISGNLRLLVLSGSKLNLIKNDWRFIRLTERFRLLFSFNL